MDKITNSVFNNTNKNVLKDRVKTEPVEKSTSTIDTIVNEKVVDLSTIKSVASDLSKSAPIDSDKVAKLKAEISAGNYPLDLDKVSDALMQAYRDMK